MFDSITLGQYYQTDSILHRLDPRVKLVGTFVYLISLFIVDSYVGYILAALFLAAMIFLSNVPFRYIVRGMKTIVFLLMITVFFNLFLTPGEGGKTESADFGILDHDAHYDADAADGRSGESAAAA